MQEEKANQLIADSKNIYLISSQEPESISCALALFYTLKELNKNVNLVADDLLPSLRFLVPSLDFISYPRNLVISIPNKTADISQIYYEKTDDSLKIHLTVNKGNIKKENIAFYFSEPKPDLVITIGIQNFKNYLSDKLNSFGFLLESSVLNIDNKPNNENFGIINLTEPCSLAETVSNIIKPETLASKKEASTCLLTSLVAETENFQKAMTAEKFELAAHLLKQGAQLNNITENLHNKN